MSLGVKRGKVFWTKVMKSSSVLIVGGTNRLPSLALF